MEAAWLNGNRVCFRVVHQVSADVRTYFLSVVLFQQVQLRPVRLYNIDIFAPIGHDLDIRLWVVELGVLDVREGVVGRQAVLHELDLVDVELVVRHVLLVHPTPLVGIHFHIALNSDYKIF